MQSRRRAIQRFGLTEDHNIRIEIGVGHSILFGSVFLDSREF